MSESEKIIECTVCPRRCKLKPGQVGFCQVRTHSGNSAVSVSTTFGRNTGLAVDPIEKKPLFQFYPGSKALSFGTAGCNMGCSFCQNWTMTKTNAALVKSVPVSSTQIAEIALEQGCTCVAYTYNDPVVWYEYAAETAKECRQRGVKNAAVTAGYILPEARKVLFEYMDAANVDLKGIRPEFYSHFCNAQLNPVLDTLKYLRNETDIWLEVTNLIIPSIGTELPGNDSDSDISAWCDWVISHLGENTPVHFSAFHPAYQLTDRPQTPYETLLKAWKIARKAGLNYVYIGNVLSPEQESTYCPCCQKKVVGRNGYRITELNLAADENNPDGIKNRCLFCNTEIAGRFMP